MITYIEQGTVKKTIREQSAANTTPPAKAFAQAKGSRSSKRSLFAQASPSHLGESSIVSVAGFQ